MRWSTSILCWLASSLLMLWAPSTATNPDLMEETAEGTQRSNGSRLDARHSRMILLFAVPGGQDEVLANKNPSAEVVPIPILQ